MTARQTGGWVTFKGLRVGTLGFGENLVIALTSVAPAYSLAATLVALVTVAGVKTPALFIVGFIPAVLTAFAFRELAKETPDCGSTFTWVTRAFGPWVGWIGGWALVVASTAALGNAAQIAAIYLLKAYDLKTLEHSTWTRIVVGGATVAVVVALMILRQPSLESTERSRAATWLLVAQVVVLVVIGVAALVTLSPHVKSTATQIALGGVIIAVFVVLCLRGIDGTERYQRALLAVELLMLVILSVVAFAKVFTGHAGPQALMPRWDWISPIGLSITDLARGTVLCVFAFWGWDTPLSVSEEAKEPTKNPGKAAVLATVLLLLTYLLVSGALQAFAGIGTTGMGLRNPAHENNALSVLGGPVLGTALAALLLLAISSSALGAVLTYVAPTARTMLAMAVYRALPRRFALVHRRYQTPWFASVVIGALGFAIYAAMTLISRNSLSDMVSALALVTTFYYALTAFACVRTYWRRARKSMRRFAVQVVFPLLGALAMTAAFAITAFESYSPHYGKTHFGPVGGVFIMGIGLLALGIPIALLCAKGEHLKAFVEKIFTRETLDAFVGPIKNFFTRETVETFVLSVERLFTRKTLKAVLAGVKAFSVRKTLKALGARLKVFFTRKTLKALSKGVKTFFTGDTVDAFFRGETLDRKTIITVSPPPESVPGPSTDTDVAEEGQLNEPTASTPAYSG
ncbi:APC family permease [Mycobacterium rhizamassiliense]|uniref:APC family permease n=1 Tax=Mycobacterium rhizamassiliense TaxID=1841860 RepID=UPI00097D19F8|nr:APC family permease [Mycobacterium rhizamassiliense]